MNGNSARATCDGLATFLASSYRPDLCWRTRASGGGLSTALQHWGLAQMSGEKDKERHKSDFWECVVVFTNKMTYWRMGPRTGGYSRELSVWKNGPAHLWLWWVFGWLVLAWKPAADRLQLYSSQCCVSFSLPVRAAGLPFTGFFFFLISLSHRGAYQINGLGGVTKID